MGRSYYIILVVILFLHVGTSQFSVQGLSSETSSAEVYTSAGDHDGIWKSEQDVIKEDKEPFLQLQQTDDQVYGDKDISVNELDTEYEKNDAKQANEGGIGQDEDQSDVEVEEGDYASNEKEGHIQENENDDTEMNENKSEIANEEDEDILGTEGDTNIEKGSYGNGGNAKVEEDDGDSQIVENEEANLEDEGNVEEVEDEDENEAEMEGEENGQIEDYEDDIDEEKDTVEIENEEEKHASADDDSLEIQNGNDDSEDISGIEKYFDEGVTEFDSAATSERQSEESEIAVQQEIESDNYYEMAENEMHTCKSKRRKMKDKKNKLRRKHRRNKNRRRRNKQRRNKDRRRKTKRKQSRNKYKQTINKNKQRRNKKEQKRKGKGGRNKDKGKQRKIENNSILGEFNKLRSLPKRLMCSEVKRKLQKLSNSGSISHNSQNIINFRVNSRSPVKLRSFIPINGYNRLKIKSIHFDCSNYALTIKTKPTNKWRIVPNILSITRVSMVLSVALNAPQQTFKVDMKGVWRVGSFTVPVIINYNHAKRLTRVEAEAHQGASLTGLVGSITGLALPLPIPSRISFTIQGEVSNKGAINLLISSLDGRNRYYAGYRKINKNAIPVKAIAVDVRRFRLSNLLRRLLKFDISQTPYFGRLIIPEIGAVYSTGRTTIDSTKVFRNSPLLQGTKNVINKGFTAFMRVSFHHEPLIVTYKNKVLLLTTPHRNLRLDKLIQAIMPGRARSQTSIPFLSLNELTKLYIEEVKVTRGSVCAAVSYPKQLSFFQNIIKLSSIKADVCVRNSKPKLSANLNGRIRIGGVTFKTKLAQNKRGKYFLSAKGNSKLNFNKLLQTFHASVLPRELSRFLRNIPFLRFSIYNPKISYVFGVKPLQLHIEGLPSIHGFKIVNMDLLVLRKNRKLQAISGFEMGKVNFAALLSRITGFNFKRFLILDQNTSPSFTISPVTLPKVHFAIGKLSSLPIDKGISIKASLKFPRNCKSDKFCRFAGRLIGFNAVLSLSATIRSATYYSVTASLHSLNLGRGFRLRKAGLEIIGGASSRIGLVGEVRLRKPNLVFAGRISVGTKGLTLQLSMKNCWHKAFGAKWLDICNLLGAIDFAPPTGITGLALGGQIHLGYRSTGRQLRAKAYIGISIINPIENYYYAKFNRLTMRSLLRAFRINWKIPRPLGNSGFPNGFMSSFSFLGKELPEVGLSIPRGLRIKGTLNILGLRSHADITVDLPRLLDINVALPPIKIGRIFSMYASSRDRKRGPYFKAKLSLYQRRVNIEAKGYLRVLGVSFSTALKITNSYYSFSFRQKLFHLFWASVYMRASYGNIRRAHFHIRGSFGVDLFRGIQNIAKSLIRNFSNAANRAVNVAKRAFHRYQRLKRRAQNKLNSLYRKLKYWKKKIFFSRIQENSLEYPKGKAHINFFRRVFRAGRRVVRRVARGGRRVVRRVARGGRRVVRRVARGGRRVVRRVGRYVKKINHYAKRVYNSVQGELNRAKRKLSKISHSLQRATRHLNYIRRRFKKGINMFNYLRRYGLGRIIRVRRATFSASLGMASTGQFSCGISVEFLGRLRHIRASINLRHLNIIGRKLFRLLKRLF